jgi:hypothetical protein
MDVNSTQIVLLVPLTRNADGKDKKLIGRREPMYLIGELILNLSIFYDRLKYMWVNKRWISDKEYYDIRRGN